MSFGFSVGDFIATGKLIKDLVSAFRHDSASSYFELVLELDGLKRALDEIELLKCPPDQQPALNSVKVAALMCQYPLNEFATKLKRYESLGLLHMDRSRERLKRTGRKIQWATSMEDDVAQLRAYITAHVGSLNTRLMTLGLKAASFRAERQAEEHSQLQMRVDQISSEIIGSRQDINRYSSLMARSASLLGHLSNIVTQGFGVKLDSLLELVTNVWNSNLHIVALITQLEATPRRPDICHTWFQEPARFEDALGRILPIPSEYAMSKVRAIISEQFSRGPGSDKVKAGEYLLYDVLNDNEELNLPDTELLIPGMSIRMSLVVGRYESVLRNRCPKAGCKSTTITQDHGQGNFCNKCRLWFRYTRLTLPLPLRPDPLLVPIESIACTSYIPRRCRLASPLQQSNQYRDSEAALKKLRDEARYYKNLTLNVMVLPATPLVSNVRRINKTSKHVSERNHEKKEKEKERQNTTYESLRQDVKKEIQAENATRDEPALRYPIAIARSSNVLAGYPAFNSNRQEAYLGSYGSYASIRSEPQWAASLSYGSPLSPGGFEEPEKLFHCPVVGCEKAYIRTNSLKYHKKHGHHNQLLKENKDGTFSIIGTSDMEKEKPFTCYACGKRYENINDFKYHMSHSQQCTRWVEAQLLGGCP